LSNPTRRFIYVVTLWQERSASPEDPAVWRFTLEDARTGHKRGFGSLEALSAYVRRRMTTDRSDQNARSTSSES
jgi:hypothetical protein